MRPCALTSMRLQTKNPPPRDVRAMQIIKRARLDDGTEVQLIMDEKSSWKGFTLQGVPEEHQKATKPQSLSSAVTFWNRIVKVSDRTSVKEISARITCNKNIH